MFLDKELREAIKPQRNEVIEILRGMDIECLPVGDTEVMLSSEFTSQHYRSLTLETYYDGSWMLTETEEESSSPYYNSTDLKLHYTECTAQDVVDVLITKL